MPVKKILKKKYKKKTTKKGVKKKNISKIVITKKKSAKNLNPIEYLNKENEMQLLTLITKEYDKEIASKAKTYIKSYTKIEDSIITINDFLNYIESLDEELFKLLKAYSSSSDRDAISTNDESEEEEKNTSEYSCGR